MLHHGALCFLDTCVEQMRIRGCSILVNESFIFIVFVTDYMLISLAIVNCYCGDDDAGGDDDDN